MGKDAFELTNAAATFQTLIEAWLGEWHLDDITVLVKLKKNTLLDSMPVFDKWRAASLKLKPSKCELFKKLINNLGNIVSSQRVSTDVKKQNSSCSWNGLDQLL